MAPPALTRRAARADRVPAGRRAAACDRAPISPSTTTAGAKPRGGHPTAAPRTRGRGRRGRGKGNNGCGALVPHWGLRWAPGRASPAAFPERWRALRRAGGRRVRAPPPTAAPGPRLRAASQRHSQSSAGGAGRQGVIDRRRSPRGGRWRRGEPIRSVGRR